MKYALVFYAGFLAVVVLGGNIANLSWANSPEKPFTASELPVMATTPNLVYGSLGPQLRLNSKTIQSIPEPIYIDKALGLLLEDSAIIVKQIGYRYTENKHTEENITIKKIELSLENIKQLAKEQLTTCQKKGYVCEASVKLIEDYKILIETMPLTLKMVEFDVQDDQEKTALKRYFAELKPDVPFSLSHLEQQIRLAQENPDFSFTTELEVIPYTHQVKVKITDSGAKKKLHIVASTNNLDQVIFGSKFAGLTLVSNNISGHGDSAMLGAVQGYRSTGGFAKYEFPIKPKLKATLEAQYANISPFQINYSQFDEHGYAYRISPGFKYTILNRPNLRLSTDLQFDFKQARSHWSGGNLEREYVRTLRGGLNYDQNIGKTYLSSRHEVAGAAPIWGGSLSDDPRLSWYKGGSQYWRYTGYANLIRPLPFKSTGSLNFQWQYTPNGLSNFDVGGLGGTFYGRGYREIYLFVDRYAIVSGQWQMPAYIIPKQLKAPFSNKPLRDATQMLTFLDYGYGAISAPPKGVQRTYDILSAGLGFRTQLAERVTGRLDIAYPIFREAPWGQRPRLHFGLDIALK